MLLILNNNNNNNNSTKTEKPVWHILTEYLIDKNLNELLNYCIASNNKEIKKLN